MNIIAAVVRRHEISFSDILNICDICFLFCIDLIYSIVIKCMVDIFRCILMRWNFLSYIFLIGYFIVYTNTWLYICYFLLINQCIKLTVLLTVIMRKVLRSYNITTVWCIQIIWFLAIDVWDHGSTSPLLILVQNLPLLFPSWGRKHHI